MREILAVVTVVLFLFFISACSDVINGPPGEVEDGVISDVQLQFDPPPEAPRIEATPTPPLPTPMPLATSQHVGHIYPVTARTIHVVQPGDTLSEIAQRYGVKVSDIAHANRIYNFHLIYVGQQIYIPPPP